MGDRGRLVVPADVRARFEMEAGTPLVLVETPRGIVLTTRELAKALIREQLRGASLVEELLRDRRSELSRETA